MYYIGKRLTREEKRRMQRIRADIVGVTVVLLILAAGFAAGRLA